MKHRYKTKNTLKETADSPEDLKQLVKDRCESCEPKSQEGHPEKEEDTNYTIQSWDATLGFSQILSAIKEHQAFVPFSSPQQSTLAKPDSANMESCRTSVLSHSLSTLQVSPLSTHKDTVLHQQWSLPRPEISRDFGSNVKFTSTFNNVNALGSYVFQGQKSKQTDQGEVRPQNLLYECKHRCGHLSKYKEVDDSDSSIISLEERPASLLLHSSLTSKHARQEDVDVFDPLRKRSHDDSDSVLLPTCSNQPSVVDQQVPELSSGFQDYLAKRTKRRKRRKYKPSRSMGLIISQRQTRLAKTNQELEPQPMLPLTEVPQCSYQPDSDSSRIDPSASPVHSSAIISTYTKHEDVDVFKSFKKKRKHANNGPKLLPIVLNTDPLFTMSRQSESFTAANSLRNSILVSPIRQYPPIPKEWMRFNYSNFSYSNDSSSVPLDLSISQHQTEQTKMFVPKLSSCGQSTSLPVTSSPECSNEEKLEEVKQAEMNPVIENDKGETLSPDTTASVLVTNTLQPSSHFQFNSTESCCLARSQSLSSLSKLPKKNLTRAASLPDLSLKEFTPAITADDFNDETYLFQCSCAGLYQCSVTGLVFVMKGEGDVVYRTVPWYRRLLAQHHKKPAGPLFDIKCQQQSVCQLHLPHCEVISTGGGQFLQVAHVKDEGIEFITPHKITETHVVINITGFSGYGNVKDEDSPPDPVRALVLLFYKPPLDPDLTSFLSVLLLPDNIVLQDVLHTRKKLVGDERYIETSPHCKLHPKQVYTLSAVPEDDSVLVQPTEAEFDEASYDNYFPSFQVILEKIMKTIKLTLRDSTRSHSVWNRQVYLSSSGVKKCCEPVPLNLSLNDKLLNVRSCFIDGISAPVLNSLLDKLLEKTVITDAEREEADVMQNRSNRARFVIDTVRKKGKAASSQIIKSLSEIDPFFCKSLGLI